MINKFKIFSDNKGDLLPINFNQLPFEPKRTFITTHVSPMEIRGQHAHKNNRQVLLCLEGEIKVDLIKVSEDKYRHYHLLPGDWIYHPNLEWAQLVFASRDSMLLSFCSDEYSVDDYMRTFEELKEYVNSLAMGAK